MTRLLVALLLASLMTACAVPLSQQNTTVLMGKKVTKDGGPSVSEISDVFTFEGPIFAFITFRWEPVDKSGGLQQIEARWFSGGREVSRRSHDATFGRSPYYVWFQTTGAALGAGDCRVDVYVRGNQVGSKSFRVVEK